MDQPKIERLLRLIKMMSGHENYTIDQLADKLGTSYRSIYRYIDTFKECGFVVLKVRSNVYKLGKMPKTHLDLKNLIYFSEEEAYIVNSLIDGLDVSNVLKGSLKKKLAAIYNSIGSIDYVVNREAAEHIEGLGKAIREKKRVILKGYESSHSNEISDRFIEPFEFTTNCIDIWGYDIEKQENRVFKISRIDRVSILEDDWANESKHQKSKTDCFRISGFTQTPVKLELSMMAKNLLLEEFPLAEKDLKLVDDRWILDTTVSGMEGVGRFVIGLASEVKIIDSPELKDYISQYVKTHLSNYLNSEEPDMNKIALKEIQTRGITLNIPEIWNAHTEIYTEPDGRECSMIEISAVEGDPRSIIISYGPMPEGSDAIMEAGDTYEEVVGEIGPDVEDDPICEYDFLGTTGYGFEVPTEDGLACNFICVATGSQTQIETGIDCHLFTILTTGRTFEEIDELLDLVEQNISFE